MSLVEAPVPRPRFHLSENLPPFHPVALQLMRVVVSDEVSLTAVARIVRADAAFTAEVLRLANSPLFGFRRQISGILQAIGLLGMERVRSLALTVALRRFLGGVPPSVALRVCWRHNLACAMIAEELALAAAIPADNAWTAGLVHDLGRLALVAGDHSRYAALLERAESEPARIGGLEREAFGIDHCQAGAALMECWHFPSELVEVAALHHEPLRGGLFGLRETVQLACRAADALGFQVVGPAPPLPDPVRERLGADAEDLAAGIALKINSFEICVQ